MPGARWQRLHISSYCAAPEAMRLASARSPGTTMSAARMATDLSLTVSISQKTGWECGLSAATSQDPTWARTAAQTAVNTATAAKVTINQRVAVREAAKSDMLLAPMN